MQIFTEVYFRSVCWIPAVGRGITDRVASTHVVSHELSKGRLSPVSQIRFLKRIERFTEHPNSCCRPGGKSVKRLKLALRVSQLLSHSCLPVGTLLNWSVRSLLSSLSLSFLGSWFISPRQQRLFICVFLIDSHNVLSHQTDSPEESSKIINLQNKEILVPNKSLVSKHFFRFGF